MKQHVEHANATLHTVSFMCNDANMSRTTLMRLATEAGALIRIGRMVKVDSAKFYDYLDKCYRVVGE